jgi:hypothetical protein
LKEINRLTYLYFMGKEGFSGFAGEGQMKGPEQGFGKRGEKELISEDDREALGNLENAAAMRELTNEDRPRLEELREAYPSVSAEMRRKLNTEEN